MRRGSMRENIDEVDKEILRMLQEDGRTSFSRIAKKLNLSEATIHLRVKRLKERGILKGFHADVDPEKVGKKVLAFILVKIDAKKYPETLSKIAEFRDVYEVHDITGEYSALLKVRVSNKDELAKLLDEIGKLDGVMDTYTMYALRTIKEKKTVEL
ncbi:AsnC family transcriptional regulator [Ignicoccus pacificus DSM 13166]|uniref:AsnC family transcriptional regulator n=1 Tax=Ignicoccus pacificus DSM 13166 TaxID=940294 RepID=A0A977PKD8_9CREN|nr:AsnC family transcriptional regulator [Ignicoccus pacificus DSM 13166]